MVEIAKRLRELERVPSHMRRLPAIHRALDGRRHLRCRQQKLPAILRLKLPFHRLTRESRPKIRQLLPPLGELAQNISSPHCRILHVWTGLPLKAESLAEIERDHRIARVLQHE